MQCKVNKRERVKRQWINHKHKDMFRGSSHCSTSPLSHRMISTISSTQDFPHREPPLRIWVIKFRSTQLLSPTNTISTQEERHNNNLLYTQRDRHLAKQQSTSQQRDTNNQTQPPQSPLTREIPINTRKVTTLGGINNHKPIFSQKLDPNRQDRQITQV